MSRSHKYKWVGELKPKAKFIHIGWTNTLSFYPRYSLWLYLYTILLSLVLFTLVQPIPYPPILIPFTLVEPIPYPILGSIHIGWTYTLSYPWFYSHWLYLISGILLSHVHPIEWCDVCVIVYYIYTIQAYTLNLVIYFSVSM